MIWIIVIIIFLILLFIGGLYGNVSQQNTARYLKKMNKRQEGK